MSTTTVTQPAGTARKGESTTQPTACYHCGEKCPDDSIRIDDRHFCCQGCRWVYQLLLDNDMSTYYSFSEGERITPKAVENKRLEFLDHPTFLNRFIQFSQNGISRVTLFLPQIHCSACIWLLENLQRLDPGVLVVRVNFLRKEAAIDFDERRTSLRRIAELLAGIGYEPDFSEKGQDKPAAAAVSRSLYIKLGIAGFAFGNTMLIALPEYLSGGNLDAQFRTFFGYVSVLLSLPVLYSLTDYFKSAWLSIRQRVINMDVPISIGILTLTSKSLYDIATGAGPGYFDTLAGLAFFLLLGKVFQKKTFYALSFNRDYKAYFPLAVKRREGGTEKSVPIEEVAVGDRLIIRHGELIPADSVLRSSRASIDYAFVTGESDPVDVEEAGKIYAGGRVAGGLIEVEVIKEVSQSYLTQLWNQDAFTRHTSSRMTTISEHVAKYFTAAILLIAVSTAVYWWIVGGVSVVSAFTSILIVACGCGLPLSVPFTLGTALRVMEKHHLYLRNDQVVERLASVDTIVFDKTGTLTTGDGGRWSYVGDPINEAEERRVKSLVRHSTHPMSRQMFDRIAGEGDWPVDDFEETAGRGIAGIVDGHRLKVGSRSWVGMEEDGGGETFRAVAGEVWIAVDGAIRGRYETVASYRDGVSAMADALAAKYPVMILSGDHDREKDVLRRLFGPDTVLRFRQLPIDKLNFVKAEQDRGRRVLMIGDGLNDAGALKQSDVGMAITENTAAFTPGSDAILNVKSLPLLPAFIRLAQQSRKIVYAAFGLIFLYNIVAMTLAVQARLTPVAAAIIMPISATSVVAFTYTAVRLYARRLGLG